MPELETLILAIFIILLVIVIIRMDRKERAKKEHSDAAPKRNSAKKS